MIDARRKLALPAWLAEADRALAVASREVRLVQAATPRDYDHVVAQAASRWEAGDEVDIVAGYDARAVRPELARGLDALARMLEGEGALGAIYAERARELVHEISMIEAVGTPRFVTLARERHAPRSAGERGDRERADAWARAWLAAPRESEPERLERWTDDAGDPESMLSRMRAEVGARRLPMRVVVLAGLASLAATADDAILVAPRVRVSDEAVRRTVAHEVDGHALPLVRASRQRLGVFAFGTARGVDEQEGRALAIERARGHFKPRRLRELATRHLAASSVLEGAAFVDAARDAISRGASARTAVSVAARVCRGGGLAREIAYLVSLARYDRLVAGRSGADDVMASGRVGISAISTLSAWVEPD